MKPRAKVIVWLCFFALGFNACSAPIKQGTSSGDLANGMATSATNEIARTIYLWLAPYLPQDIQEQISLPENVRKVETQNEADIWVDVGGDQPISQWVYALVAPFPTITDSISFQELLRVWKGEVDADSPVKKILIDGNTKAVFEKMWGVAESTKVVLTSEEDFLSTAWDEEGTWAIIPFEKLEPRWKVIALDAISPLDDDFKISQYPLSVSFSLFGKTENLMEFLTRMNEAAMPLVPKTNRDENKITTVILTGVTALVRGTAYMMERYGMTYPALDIGAILRSADITHISNEVPFTKNCPNPFYNKQNDVNLVFCSKPEYIVLLESVGTDVVELTGDHFRDWGADAMLNTLQMYDERGWKYYGGGRNLADGQKPALFEHNGNKIAFLGCNAKLEGYATASSDSPGAAHCDMEELAAQIKAVKEKGYIPIVTFQHLEYYRYTANPYLVKDFRAAADAGAAIVSGSQAHQPHAFEFYKGAFFHYGLGNLFFDQYNEGTAQRQAFIDQYIIYEGRVLNVDLISIEFVDMARSRLMTTEERKQLLKTVFAASGW